MKYAQIGNCPYCDSERGVCTPWGMSPEGWTLLKERHDNGHPENLPKEESKYPPFYTCFTPSPHKIDKLEGVRYEGGGEEDRQNEICRKINQIIDYINEN